MKYIISFLLLLIALPGYSQTLDKTVTVESPDTTGKTPISQLVDQANQKMAEDLIIDYVGAEAYNRSKDVLTAKVIKNSQKFTPYQRTSDIERGPFGIRVTVQYKVSLTDFRKLLSDAGMFSKTRLANNILSFITIENESGDRIGESWNKKTKSSEALDWMQEWNEDFKKVFEKAGFTYNKNLNPVWLEQLSNDISAQDIMNRNTLKSSFILWGTGRIIRDKISHEKILSVKMKIYSQEYRKEVTDSARRFSIRDDGHPKFEVWAQDLVSQIDDIDVKSLNQEPLMRLVINGSVPLMEQDQFRQLIINSTPLIKTVSERRFASNEIVYEVETDSTPQILAQKLKNLTWKGHKLKAETSQNEIRLEILK